MKELPAVTYSARAKTSIFNTQFLEITEVVGPVTPALLLIHIEPLASVFSRIFFHFHVLKICYKTFVLIFRKLSTIFFPQTVYVKLHTSTNSNIGLENFLSNLILSISKINIYRNT